MAKVPGPWGQGREEEGLACASRKNSEMARKDPDEKYKQEFRIMDGRWSNQEWLRWMEWVGAKRHKIV